MSESSNLCLSCNICCEGTTIGFVQLDDNEISTIKELKEIEEANGKGFFLQPCDKLGCNGCSIYSQRPRQCASYNCKLLKSVENKELNFDHAVDIVNRVKEQKAAIENKLASLEIELQSKSFYFKMFELKKLHRKHKKEPTLSNKLEELVSELKQLDKLLLDSFGVSFY